MSEENGERKGAGFALFGLLVGLGAGGIVYAIAEHWVDETKTERLPLTVLVAVAVFAAAFLLLAEKRAMLRALLPAAAISAILSAPTWFMLQVASDSANLNGFPAVFWFLIGAPLAGYLMMTLAKASLFGGVPPRYSDVFIHGVTLPLIAGGAKVFAILALVLIYAWAALLKSMDVAFFHKLFQEPWFMLPFLGGIGGLSIALMRGLENVLGALRFILMLFCRIAMPITAVFSLTFVAVLAVNGVDAVLDSKFYPGGLLLGLSFVGMLIFNGVYQNGEGGPPPAWLRLATVISLVIFPVYAGLAAYAFWLRIGDYGLTPARVIGAAMNGLAALYILVCLAGLLTELNWLGKKWMRLVAPLNTMMALIWIIVLLALASPIFNPWAMSAKSQEARLAEGRVAAAEFDFGYLRFSLGEYGEAALDRLLALHGHPEATAIRNGVARARAAPNQWVYENGEPGSDPQDPAGGAAPGSGPMQLEINPEGADYGEEDEQAGVTADPS